MKLLQQLLTQDNQNSRFAYLVQNLCQNGSLVALVLASIWKGLRSEPDAASQEKVLYAFFLTISALMSGGVINGVGRWAASKKPPFPTPPMESSETETTTVVKEKNVSAKGKPGK